VSPYLDRIESMVANNNVSLYACERSIVKAEKKEGAKVVLLPNTVKKTVMTFCGSVVGRDKVCRSRRCQQRYGCLG
jgi:hypothetical protein